MNTAHLFCAPAGLILAISGLLIAPDKARASTQPFAPGSRPVAVAVGAAPWPTPLRAQARIPQPAPTATGNPGVLDRRHQFALGMLETGNHDSEIGGAGEVSRYQIMPSVWRHYSASHDYGNPQVSLGVARRHWIMLYESFKQQAGRDPTDFDMYVLWNTHFGYYAGRHFNPARLAPAVRDRAQRYVNLVQSGET